MSDTSKLREWADSDTQQAAVIRYLVALGSDDARAELSEAQAQNLDATAAGWTAIADAADAQVVDPEQHP